MTRRPEKRNGKWMARYVDRDGRTRSAGTYDLRREAQDAINAAQEALKGPQGDMTVRQYARSWLETHPRSQRTNETHEHRLQILIGAYTEDQVRREQRDKVRLKRKHVPRTGIVVEGRPLGDWPIAHVRPRHGRMILHALLVTQGRAAEGARGIMRSLSAMYEDAIADDLAEVNPAKVKLRGTDPRISKPAREPRVVTWDQMHELAHAAGEHEPMIRLAADCGLRLGELLGLEARDVKLDRCDECAQWIGPHLHVRRTAHDGTVSQGTKRERMRDRYEGGRIVPVPPVPASMLRALPPRISGPMWFTERGRVWREDNFRFDVWNPARVRSGVEASPQDFRHSWVSLLRAEGVDPADLAQIGGHSVDVASATYTHALGRSYDFINEAVGR